VAAPTVIPAETPAPDQDAVETAPAEESAQISNSGSSPVPPSGSVIDDFEAASLNWIVYSDEGKDTRLVFERDARVAHKSEAGLKIVYDIVPDSWATCSLVYPSPQNWQKKSGVALYLHGEQIGREVTIVVYQGSSADRLGHFEFIARINKAGLAGWQRVEIPWEELAQPSWEGDGSTRLDPTQVMGMAFAFSSDENTRRQGTVWVDDIGFLME